MLNHRRSFCGLPVLAIVLTCSVTSAWAREPLDAGTLQSLESRSRTGVLYDRVVPLAHLERLDGSASAPATDLGTWRQAYDELRRASLAPPRQPDLAGVLAGARASIRAGVLPLAIIDRAYESLTVDAAGSEPGLAEARTFVAAVLVPRTYRGEALTFELDRERFFSDTASPPRRLEIDFADGSGFRDVRWGEPLTVSYRSTGVRTLSTRLTRADGSVAVARFTFEVAALATPSPDDTLHITAAIPYQGELGTGDAYVYRAPGHADIENPVVVIEGFDLDNSMNWDELYALLNQENLVETLRAEGFDIVVLNFTDATVAIQENSFVVAELVQEVQALVPPTTSLALIGASMGGLCSRYALAYLESHGIPYRVRTWISFDAPHAGANIPLGVQYWIQFFASQSADAADFLATLQRPAARQMLVYHVTNPPGTTGEPDPMRGSMLTDFAAVGGYPTLTRRVAIANGSGTAQSQGFQPLDQLIQWEYSSLFAAITGDVWALPNQVSGTIFRGSIRILFSTTSQTVTVTGTQPWDGAPGGSRASLAQLDSTAAPYGDIVALHPSHCFIPTISSLALNVTDPFFDVAADPDILSRTPFDAVYDPVANQEHVFISPENAVWVRSEIERGVVSAPAGRPVPARATLGVAPNPFSSATSMAIDLPRGSDVDVSVFGIDGRKLRQLVQGSRPAGSFAVSWDGRDDRGARVPAGVYFLKLASASGSVTRAIVKLD